MHSSSIVHLILSILIFVLGTLINVKFLKNMKDDDRNLKIKTGVGLLVKRVMTTHTITLIVSTPILLIGSWLFYQNYELPTWFRFSFCYGIYIIQGLRIYHSFNSLVVAAMRYSFIVHRNAILRFGKENAKTLFYYGSISTPIIIEILIAFSVQKPVFYSTAMSAVLPLCTHHDSYSRIDLNVTITQEYSLPVYSFVHRYISADITYYVKKFLFLLIAIILGNMVEGVLYYKTFAQIKR